MTISDDLRPAVALVPAQATAVPAPASIPAPAGSPEVDVAARVRDAVQSLRRALADGTVHQHRCAGVPESWTALGVEVVRAWTSGLDLDAQRRVCRTCAP
ncbi:hypothetical protein [Actinomycetospora sp. TBRC 11914]|uniref:hypothetical protein n=1 Tax=Actinomycetospora sp. TBRC 11914 TaxID=2729387 RepID=UPI00145FA699|nr:hypothetical protein [Actinomycetospora sp. TBRC 11914]NMO89380.1 hypothetical protein [Actinomycetospora sp. TBRC 11914]